MTASARWPRDDTSVREGDSGRDGSPVAAARVPIDETKSANRGVTIRERLRYHNAEVI
jgi:hypothetical protein